MTSPISPLRQRMIDDMKMRNIAPSTQKVYTYQCLHILLIAIMLEDAEAAIVRTMCASSAMPFLIPAVIVAAKSP